MGSSDEDRRSRKEHKKKKERKKKEHKRKRTKEEDEYREKKKSAHLVSMFGYTNQDNPFGDSKLTEQFVWKKKKEKKNKRSFKERIQELDHVRESRKKREQERAEFQRLRDEQQRQKEFETFGNIEEKVSSFSKEQDKNRVRMRLKNGRGNVVDQLCVNLLLEEECGVRESQVLDPSMLIREIVNGEPRFAYELLEKLTLSELKDPVEVDIQSFIGNSFAVDYWKPVLNVVEGLIRKRERRPPKFASQVENMIVGKTERELTDMKKDIESKRLGAGLGDDAYWKYVLLEIGVELSKYSIRENHAKLIKVLQDHGIEMQKLAGTGSSSSSAVKEEFVVAMPSAQQKFIVEPETIIDDPSLDIVDELKDRMDRRKARIEVIRQEAEQNKSKLYEHLAGVSRQQQNSKLSALAIEARQFRDRLLDQVDNGEQLKARDEVPLPKTVLSWHDKYKPRKPLYVNFVKTGYDWNKYNQTHYDMENPPPKTVQGYKFNIFYPDLVDNAMSPSYSIEKADSDEYCVIRFKAGPPYEDIAFKIINKEW
eukprot:CAMPEP_0203749472 /NCGR_PEP_ID=MMETSP0098-20131031/4032_1 /ASSEMBLY_ACC=CAM_ASM_000208 /TAXON_ID=96639 /ORGANISM=" , Strain NY0313808BC1" /LENGTH=537 /DNA_ID=CAMNT_0050638543 /DNA_START=243 /DNA_END=1853 /DNA_ORIENTATION=+